MRVKEEGCVQRLNGAWRHELRKLPISYRVDRAVIHGDAILAWLEIKCRTHSFATYDTLLLSMLKWSAGIEWFRVTGLPFVVVASLEDGDFYYVFRDDDEYTFVITFTGRTKNTRDDGDVEPVIHIPMGRFTRVEGGGLPKEIWDAKA